MTTVFAAGNVTSSSEDLLDWATPCTRASSRPRATATMLDMLSLFTPDTATNHLVATDEPSG